MTSPQAPKQAPHPWSKEALLAKAQAYAEEMLTLPRDDWRFVLWSTFTLEMLLRAALASTSPALLADSKDWNNTLFALGIPSKAQRFTPRSLETALVVSRLRELVPAFDTELEGFALSHIAKRNEELHTGSTPLEGLSSSIWLPPSTGPAEPAWQY